MENETPSEDRTEISQSKTVNHETTCIGTGCKPVRPNLRLAEATYLTQ